MRPMVSLTLIVRDEEATLPGCLDPIAGLFREIVVVDTGSTDRTREVALRFGARVIEAPWQDSFAAARNAALENASAPWIFWMDADDRLDEGNRDRLRTLLETLTDEPAAYLMQCRSTTPAGINVSDHIRLFPNHPAVRWRYRVHEQILPALQRLAIPLRPTPVIIHHIGYEDPERYHRKLERNLRLLRLEHAEQPDDPEVLLQLGQNLLALGQPAEALPLLRRGLERARPGEFCHRRLSGQLARAYHLLGQRFEALEVCRAGQNAYPDYAELLFLESTLWDELGEPTRAEACLLRLVQPGSGLVSGDLGVCGYKARHNLALLCHRQGRLAEAAAHWRAALAEAPGFLPARRGLTALEQAAGRETVELAAPLQSSARRRMTVSLCLIVRDEEEALPACLRSAADLVDEVVVVDTGSVDRSREVAAQFGARVHDFAWVDDFAAARNESLCQARGDWVFWLDGDEWLDEANRVRLRALFASLRDEQAAYAMWQLCLRQSALPGAPGGFDRRVEQVRLFRNHPSVRWRYRVYEQILPAVRLRGGEVRRTEVVIHHAGYQDAAGHRRKIMRNLRLAELDQRDNPNDAYIPYTLGIFHQMLGQDAEAVSCLRASRERLPAQASYAAKLHALLVQGHLRLGQTDLAWAVCQAGRSQNPEDNELLYQEALLRQQKGDRAGAESCLRELEARLAHSAPADGEQWQFRQSVWHGLAKLLQQRGCAAEAESRWRALLTEQPDFAVGWLELGDLYIALGRWQELEPILQRLAGPLGRREDAVVLRSRLHLARREFAAARALLEEAIRRAPGSLRPRQALSHVLLLEGRDPAAAEEALLQVLALCPDDRDARRNLDLLRRPQGRVPVS